MWSSIPNNRFRLPASPPSNDSSPSHFNVDWAALHQELTNTHSLLSYSLHDSSQRDYLHLSHNLFNSIIHDVYFLLHGFPFNPQLQDHRPTPILTVWPAAHEARSVIIDNLIHLASRRRSSRTATLPVVVLITDTYPLSESGHATSCDASESLHKTEPNADTNDPFITSWHSICKPRTQLFVVVPQSAQKLCSAVDAILEPSSHERSSCPALIILYLSCDSFITSDLLALRAVCDSHHAHLCVDGPGTALLAQPNTPSDPQNCLHLSDLIIVDPSSWFGFDDCAVVLFQNDQSSIPISRHQISVRTPFPAINALEPPFDKFPQILIPFLKLWTVLSRVGSHTMRHMVDHATTLAESFVHLLRSSTNLHASYEGVACVVRISYTLPRDDRLMAPHRARNLLSTINDAIFARLGQQASALGILRGEGEHGSFIHFSPARLLSWGSTTVPTLHDVRSFVHLLQDAADRYETCRVGSPIFSSHIAKSPHLLSVDNQERSDDLILSHGCFRIVPVELQRTWRHVGEELQKVEFLTSALAAELSNATALNVVSDFSPNTKRNGSDQMVGCWAKVQQDIGKDSTTLNLPFAFFLHSEMPMGIPEFISVEPRVACPPVEAVHQAQFAAKLVVNAAQTVMSKWSDNNHIPYDLTPYNGMASSKEERRERNILAPNNSQERGTHMDMQGLPQETDESDLSEGDDFHSATNGDNEPEGHAPYDCGPTIRTSASNQYESCFSSHSRERYVNSDTFFDNFAVGDFGPLEPLDEMCGNTEYSEVISDSVEIAQELDEIQAQSEPNYGNLNTTPRSSELPHLQNLSQDDKPSTAKTVNHESSWLSFLSKRNPFRKNCKPIPTPSSDESSNYNGMGEDFELGSVGHSDVGVGSTEYSVSVARNNDIHAPREESLPESQALRQDLSGYDHEPDLKDSALEEGQMSVSSRTGYGKDGASSARQLSKFSSGRSLEVSSDETGPQSQTSLEGAPSSPTSSSPNSTSSRLDEALGRPSYLQTSIATTILNWFYKRKTLDAGNGSRPVEEDERNIAKAIRPLQNAASTICADETAALCEVSDTDTVNVEETKLGVLLYKSQVDSASISSAKVSTRKTIGIKRLVPRDANDATVAYLKKHAKTAVRKSSEQQNNEFDGESHDQLPASCTENSSACENSREEGMAGAEDIVPMNENRENAVDNENWAFSKLWGWLGRKSSSRVVGGKNITDPVVRNDPGLSPVQSNVGSSYNDIDSLPTTESLSGDNIPFNNVGSEEAFEGVDIESDSRSERDGRAYQASHNGMRKKKRRHVGSCSRGENFQMRESLDDGELDDVQEQNLMLSKSSAEDSACQVSSDTRALSNSSPYSKSCSDSLAESSEQAETYDFSVCDIDNNRAVAGSVDRDSIRSSVSEDTEGTFFHGSEEHSNSDLSSCSESIFSDSGSESVTYESDYSPKSRSDRTSLLDQDQGALQSQGDESIGGVSCDTSSIDALVARHKLPERRGHRVVETTIGAENTSSEISNSTQLFSSSLDSEDFHDRSTLDESSDGENSSIEISESSESLPTSFKVTHRSNARKRTRNNLKNRCKSSASRRYAEGGVGSHRNLEVPPQNSSLQNYFSWVTAWTQRGR